LLDGKYEISAERFLGDSRTLFEAAAPDGTLVLIVWFALAADEEPRFENYRRALKRLTRDGHTAVYDVVSRPGAHYVAWRAAGDSRPATADPALVAALAEHGFTPADADIRRSGRRNLIHDLAWAGQVLPGRSDAPARAPRREKPRPLPAWAVSNGLALLLVACAGLLFLAGFLKHNNNRLVAMPDVLTLDISQAARLVSDSGLIPEAFPVPSEQAAGTVIRSGVTPGVRLRPGRTVRLAYAFPPGQARPATVPRLKGLRYPEQVESLLDSAALRTGTVARIHSATPEAIVISQSVEPDSTVGEGSAVNLLVSAGPADRLTFLPDLQGLSVEEARYLASLAGLRSEQVQEDLVPASGAEAGTVLRQSLLPWHEFRQRDAVLRLNVAAGSGAAGAATLLPSLTGLSVGEARDALPDFEIQVLETGTLELPEGIIGQNPPAGSTVQDGVLTLTVNLHPRRIPQLRPVITVRSPEQRSLGYNWYIEPGIGIQRAHVFAITLEGDRILVAGYQVQGGDIVQGEWSTSYPGVVHFELLLNNEPYGGQLLAR
jgi:beta-lactam-binding protein with PASTA domain